PFHQPEFAAALGEDVFFVLVRTLVVIDKRKFFPPGVDQSVPAICPHAADCIRTVDVHFYATLVLKRSEPIALVVHQRITPVFRDRGKTVYKLIDTPVFDRDDQPSGSVVDTRFALVANDDGAAIYF